MVDESIPQADLEAAQQRQQRRQRYEQWMQRCILGGVLALFASMLVWMAFEIDLVLWAGALALPAGYIAYIAIEYASPMKVRDERERQHEHESDRLAIYIVGFIFVTITPLATTADTTGLVEVPGIVWGVVVAYTFLFVILTLSSWVVDRRNR